MVAGGQIVGLGRAVEHVVVGLRHDRPRHAQPVGDADHVGDLPAAEIGKAPMADGALGDQLAQRTDHLVQRRRLVVEMQVVEVDRLGLQPLARHLRGPGDPGRRQAARSLDIGDRVADLGRQHAIGAALLQEPPQHRLGLAAGIGIGGVDEIAAGLEITVQHPRRLGLVGPVGEHHRAEAEARHLRSAAEQGNRRDRRHGMVLQSCSIGRACAGRRRATAPAASVQTTPSARNCAMSAAS